MDVDLRLATAQDSLQILEIYRPIVQHTAISFEHVVPTAEEMAGRIHKTTQQYPWLVCTLAGEIAGYTYGSRFRERTAYQWTVEVTVYVCEQHRGYGIGRALYTALFELLRLQGYQTALAVIALPNLASIALHESMGFTPVGVFQNVGFKLGRWHDTGWWQRPLQPTQPASDVIVPRSLHDVMAIETGARALHMGRALIRR